MHQRTEQEIMQNWKGDIDTPLVSVCTITYNQENYITETIDGFLMQETDFPFELLISDDCSPDGTADIIKQYMEKFPNIIKTTLRDKNVGMSINARGNVQRAKGKYIALCEGDDYWTDPLKLQIQVKAMKDNPSCYMSFHPVRETLTNQIITRHYNKNTILNTEEIIAGGGFFCSTPSIMFDKRVIEKLPSFFENTPVGDYYLQILGSVNGGALYIDKTMAVYRVFSEGSWSTVHRDGDKGIQFYKATLKSLDDLNSYLDNKYEKAILQKKSRYAYIIANSYLHRHDYIGFKKYIEMSIHMGDAHSIGMMIFYYLRKFPKVLKFILKVYEFIIAKN